MHMFRFHHRRFYGFFTWSKLNSLAKVSKNRKILVGLVGLSPVIPAVSAQSLSTNKESNPSSTNAIGVKGSLKELNIFDEEKTPWERVKAIFEVDEFGNISKEMNATLNTCYMAMFVGALYGGIQKSRIAFTDFMERNQATIFDHPRDAKRKLQNHVTIHFGKGALHWAIKLSVFSGGFMLMFLALHAYRGTVHLKDYAISAAIMGAVTRVKLGPRGIIVGGALGGSLGFLCGLVNNSFLDLFGVSYDDILAAQYKMDSDRAMLFAKSAARERENSGTVPKIAFEMLKTHDDKPKEI